MHSGTHFTVDKVATLKVYTIISHTDFMYVFPAIKCTCATLSYGGSVSIDCITHSVKGINLNKTILLLHFPVVIKMLDKRLKKNRNAK